MVLPPRADEDSEALPPAEEPTDAATCPETHADAVVPPPAPPSGEPGSGQTPLPPPPALP